MVDKLILNIPKPVLAPNSLPVSKDTPPPLDPKDYPSVRFWTAKAFEAYCISLTGETDGMATQQKRRGRRRKDDDNEDRYPYLENVDGTPVPWDVIVKIGQKARRVWHTLNDIGQAPASWGKASETAYSYFNSEILNVPELEFLRFCEGNWKVTRWATKAYASWAHNYLRSKDALDAAKPARVNKRKRELLDDPSLLQIDDDKDEDDVTAQSPEPTQTSPAPTTVPMPVSFLCISQSLLKPRLNISNPRWLSWIPCT
jgi:hypothetical protein